MRFTVGFSIPMSTYGRQIDTFFTLRLSLTLPLYSCDVPFSEEMYSKVYDDVVENDGHHKFGPVWVSLR